MDSWLLEDEKCVGIRLPISLMGCNYGRRDREGSMGSLEELRSVAPSFMNTFSFLFFSFLCFFSSGVSVVVSYAVFHFSIHLQVTQPVGKSGEKNIEGW
ncbi:hypothetical protein ASPWEDRAFT_42970 [Aspergillus wentii DTO 134E9]|uniref:Uncharacterized protein n=1 Tax=Aspergillus wentii DTO 134E9 TaxID=1073089 RepID=A0A1L9RDB5_ASPWE|nr:uncharacterized protein ASPWEDRAFT_42970 [Aspergillus wentii DTO 134E9]OJJ32939.1 hypothetical protein ASPWEDRAFT_42970 [Aspergillus wentii DTO 134E9]